MTKLLVKFFKDNVLYLKNGEVWAYYKVPSEHVSMIAGVKKEKDKEKKNHFFEELAQFGKIDIKMIPRDMTLPERFSSFSESFLESSKETALHYVDKTIEYLKQDLGQAYVYDWLIGVQLSFPVNVLDFKGAFKNQLNLFSKGLFNAFGYEVEVPEDWFTQYEDLESNLYQKILLLNGSRVSQDEMYYLNRLNYIRGMEHTVESESMNVSVDNIMDSVIDVGTTAGLVKLSSYEGKSVCAFIPLSETVTDLSYTHMSETLQMLPFPVELHYQLEYKKVTGFGGIKKRSEDSELRLNNIVEEMLDSGNTVTKKWKDNHTVLKNLKENIERDAIFVEWTATVVVFAEDEKEVLSRVDMLISTMKKNGMDFVRAQFDQEYLFSKCLMGNHSVSDKNWVQTSTLKAFCENLVMVNHRVGNRTGWYIGRVDERYEPSKSRETALDNSNNLVLYSMLVANKDVAGSMTDSPHIAITGETGKGKSYLMKLLHFYVSFMARTLMFDPKGEIRRWYSKVVEDEATRRDYPLLVKHIESFNFVTLDVANVDNHGVLDPIIFLPKEKAREIAEAIFREVYNFDNRDEVELFLLRAIDEVIQERQDDFEVGLMSVLDRMRASTNELVRNAGELIYAKVDNSILMLAFSDGKRQGLDLDREHTILEIAGLNLPKATDSPEHYTSIQKQSLCLMFCIGRYCELFGSRDNEEETVSFYDEIWQLMSSKVGAEIFKSLKRIGRSYNNMLVYGTQSVIDVTSEDDHGNFGTLFAFDEPKERAEILKHLGAGINQNIASGIWYDHSFCYT